MINVRTVNSKAAAEAAEITGKLRISDMILSFINDQSFLPTADVKPNAVFQIIGVIIPP